MYRVLIADDEKIGRKGVHFLLDQMEEELDIVEAKNGKEALEYIQNHSLDILLTDIKMPFLDGIGLIQEAVKIHPQLKIAIFSGYSDFEYAKKALSLGVLEYILKPVNPEEFKTTIQRIIAEVDKLHETQQDNIRKEEIIKEHILAGTDVALNSDAGTPGISDPGFLLVRTCVAEGIEVETLPGATACIPAIVSSGLPCDRFCFEGFLPVKKGRQTLLKTLANESRTMIFYESPYRLVKTLLQMIEYFGEKRECSVAREISKIHEEYRRGTLAEVAEWFEENEPKGEIVIVVAGAGLSKRNIEETEFSGTSSGYNEERDRGDYGKYKSKKFRKDR